MIHRPSIDRRPIPMDPADAQAVEAAVRDYIDSWHRGDPHRMELALHDDLVKRTTGDDDAPGELTRVTKTQMVQLTRAGGGRTPDADAEIVVHHVEQDMASAQVATEAFLDFLHLSKTNGVWRIVHDLFRQLG